MRTLVSIIVPAYNEADNLEALVAEIGAVMGALGRPYETIVVDDGSTDGTGEVLAGLAGRSPGLRLVRLRERSGQSAAFMAGFEAAGSDLVVTLDADLQNDPADIPRLLELAERHDVVCGVRARRHDPLLRRISSRVANAVRRRLIQDGASDTGCSLKVFRRVDLLALPRFDGMHRFFPALLQWQGKNLVEVPVAHRPRRAGRSKYNLRNRLPRTLLDLLGVIWMKRRRLRYEVKS